MKISIDNELVFELSETKKKVLKNDIPAEEFDADMKRRLQWVLENKYERSLKRLRDEWLPKLKEAKIRNVPLDDEEFAEFVFKQQGYKDRSQRKAEGKE